MAALANEPRAQTGHRRVQPVAEAPKQLPISPSDFVSARAAFDGEAPSARDSAKKGSSSELSVHGLFFARLPLRVEREGVEAARRSPAYPKPRLRGWRLGCVGGKHPAEHAVLAPNQMESHARDMQAEKKINRPLTKAMQLVERL